MAASSRRAHRAGHKGSAYHNACVMKVKKRLADAFKEQSNTFNTTMSPNVALEHLLTAASSCHDNMTGIMTCLSTIQPIVQQPKQIYSNVTQREAI